MGRKNAKRLIIVTGTRGTIAVVVVKDKVIQIEKFDGIFDKGIEGKLPDAEEKQILLDDTLCRNFVFSKGEVAKDGVFAKIVSEMGTSDIAYSTEEYEGKFFIVSATARSNIRGKFSYAGSLEWNVAKYVRDKFKKPVILKGRNFWYVLGQTAAVYHNPEKIVKEPESLLVSPFADIANEEIAETRKYVTGTPVRPWLSAKIRVGNAVTMPEWGYVARVITDWGNMTKETFTSQVKSVPPEIKRLIAAVVIMALGPAVTFGTKFIPYSLPFTPVKTIVPENLTVTTPAQLEKFVYNKGNNYSLYYVVKDGKRLGYFINRDTAIQAAKANKWKVVKVDYSGKQETGSTQIYP